MNKTGRPRNTFGSLYLRRDSRVWWMSYRDHKGKFRQESTGRKEKGEAEKAMRKRLVARDEGLPPSAAPDAGISFNEWADWFLANRSKPPFRSEQTHRHNLGALKFLRPRFGKHKLSDITVEEIESYLMTRLNTGRMASSTVFHQLFPLVALTQLQGVCFRSQRLRLAPLMGEFSDSFLTVVAATVMLYGLRSLFRLFQLQTSVFLPPPVVGLSMDSGFLASLGRTLPVRHPHFYLP